MEQEASQSQLDIEEVKKAFIKENKDVAEEILARFLIDSIKNSKLEEK